MSWHLPYAEAALFALPHSFVDNLGAAFSLFIHYAKQTVFVANITTTLFADRSEALPIVFASYISMLRRSLQAVFSLYDQYDRLKRKKRGSKSAGRLSSV